MAIKYRALDPNFDMTFGQGDANFLVDSPEAVAQLVKTRLLLYLGEWFLDTTDGTPWLQKVIGKSTSSIYDRTIQDRILRTPGVKSIDSYQSILNRETRHLEFLVTITTVYSVNPVTIVQVL